MRLWLVSSLLKTKVNIIFLKFFDGSLSQLAIFKKNNSLLQQILDCSVERFCKDCSSESISTISFNILLFWNSVKICLQVFFHHMFQLVFCTTISVNKFKIFFYYIRENLNFNGTPHALLWKLSIITKTKLYPLLFFIP